MKNKYIFIGIFALIFVVCAINVSASQLYYENYDGVATANFSGGTVGASYKYNTTNGFQAKQNTYNAEYYYSLYSLSSNSTFMNYSFYQVAKIDDVSGGQYYGQHGIGFYNGTTRKAVLFITANFTQAFPKTIYNVYRGTNTDGYATKVLTLSSCANTYVGDWVGERLNITRIDATNYNITAYIINLTSGAIMCSGSATLSDSDIQTFDNIRIANKDGHGSGSIGYKFDEVSLHSIDPPSAPTMTNGISFLSQIPTNLTAFSLFSQSFNVTYNFTNQSMSLSGIGLNYSLTGSQSCMVFINGSCILLNNTYQSIESTTNVRVGNSSIASWILGENSIYPSTAIRNSTFFNQSHSVYSMTINNDFLAYKLINVSNITRSNLLELMINTTTVNRIYACNSSIALTGALDPLTNANCQEIGSVNAIGFNHSHGSFSGHNVIPFSIVNGKIGGSGITVTNTMWFIVRGNNLGTVRIGYVNNGSLATSVYTTGNGGVTWTDQSGSLTIDSHLHQYAGSEFVNYYAYATFNGSVNVSATVNELIDVPPVNPTPVIITVPFNTQQSTRYLNITYSNATANTFGSSIVKYNITLLNSDMSFNRTITADNGLNNSYNYDLYAQNLSLGQYFVRVYAFDNLNNSAFDEEWFNLTRNAILNLTAYDLVTNVSISNLNVTVTDQTTGLTEVWNTTGSLLNIDIVKSRFYTLYFDVPNYAYETVNYSSNTSFIQKLNQSLTKTNSVTINVYDESSLALITNVTGGGTMNITFIADSGSTTYNTTTGTLFVSNITEGTYEVKFNAPLYAQRSYYLTITNRSTQTLNAYLSQSTINLLLTYVNKETGELIENVGVNVYKIINGSWTAVATGFTDITGRWQVSVTTNTNYRFSSTITGYDDKTFNLNPVIFTAYTIQLTKQQESSTQLDFSNINVYIINTTFTNNGSNSFSWQISAPSGNLEQYAYSLSTQCKNISSFSGVNAFGGINVDTFNLTCASVTDHVTLKYNYTLTGGEIRSFTYTYSIIGTARDGSFMANNNEHYGMGIFERILLVVLITIVMAGLITKFSNIVAGLGAGLLIMSYLSYIGFIEWWLIAPTLLVGFVLITSWSTTR